MRTITNNVKRLLAVAAVIFAFGSVSKAQFPESVGMNLMSNQKVAILVHNPEKQDMKIEFTRNTNGELVYQADLNDNEKFAKIFDFSLLPQDNYTLKYTVGNKVYEKVFLSRADAKSILLSETKYQMPSFSHDEKTLSVTVVNNLENEDVSISFRKGSESFFTDKPGTYKAFKRSYSLDKLEPGEYNISLVRGKENYNYTFIVK